jgi:pimeloyl-ACP methyl ester carboxylesterase
VLLHGGSAHARWWDFVVPHLGPPFRALALDLRGHGDSEWAASGDYRLADHAQDVAELFSALRLDRPALVGHSFGAFVALHAAVVDALPVDRLVLVDARASFGAGGSRYLRLLGMLAAVRYATIGEAITKFRPLPKETIASAQVLAHVARHGFRCEDGFWVNKFDRASLARHEPFDVEGRLGELACPVLFVRGEHSKVLSAATAARLAQACRRARVVEIPGCHHHVLIDRPDLLGAQTRGFLLGHRAVEHRD